MLEFSEEALRRIHLDILRTHLDTYRKTTDTLCDSLSAGLGFGCGTCRASGTMCTRYAEIKKGIK